MKIVDKLRSGVGSWGLLMGAVLLGGLAFVVTQWYLKQQQVALEQELLGQQGAKRPVVVATMPLLPGDVLGAANMAIAEIATGNLSEAAVSPDNFGEFEGKVLTTPMSQGEPLLGHFVAGFGAERFSDLLLAGERAVTIPVDEIKSSDSMLVYGDRIDLLLLLEDDKGTPIAGNKPKKLAPLVENVRVLAVGRRALVARDADFAPATDDPMADQTYSTVTVGVSADIASRLLLARDLGSIVVMIRNRTDEDPMRSDLLSLDGLLSGTSREGAFEYFSNTQVADGALFPKLEQVSRPPPPKATGAAGGTATPAGTR